MFPKVDPIPLPAPVWLFKVLEMLTVTLHFLAVYLLVAGLIATTVWAILGRRRSDGGMLNASGAIASRLPVLMTFVINLGVPPLLFAQVLYGRAIYTSSILMGVYWISVVFLLMVAYTMLYVMTGRINRGRPWGLAGLVALLVVLVIGMIYTSNMTLMIRPQAWVESYRNDPLGLHLNHSDPTFTPRWLFMMLGSLSVGGAGMLLLALTKSLPSEGAAVLRRWGTKLMVAGAILQTVFAVWVFAAQPDGVWTAMTRTAQGYVYVPCMILWCAVTVGVAALGALGGRKADSADWKLPVLAGLVVFVQTALTAIIRGGIRDVTLLAHGYNVWDREVASNWIVVGAFLLLFVGGLAAVGWLVSVMAQAKPLEEKYA